MTRETNKRIEKVIVSYNPPEDHNVLWLHPKYRILRMFETGEWRFVNDWGILVKVLKQHRDMLDLLDQRVTDCENDIFQLNTTVAGLSSTCSNLSKRMTTVESTCSNLENRLKTVEDMVSSNTNLCPIKNDIVLPIVVNKPPSGFKLINNIQGGEYRIFSHVTKGTQVNYDSPSIVAFGLNATIPVNVDITIIEQYKSAVLGVWNVDDDIIQLSSDAQLYIVPIDKTYITDSLATHKENHPLVKVTEDIIVKHISITPMISVATIQDQIIDIHAEMQTKEDNTLLTTDKNIVGAINELYNLIKNL